MLRIADLLVSEFFFPQPPTTTQTPVTKPTLYNLPPPHDTMDSDTRRDQLCTFARTHKIDYTECSESRLLLHPPASRLQTMVHFRDPEQFCSFRIHETSNEGCDLVGTARSDTLQDAEDTLLAIYTGQ